MEQVRYMISDAANIVAVESHVLRYWEDELELTVPRNELGHRYYTQENVDQFLRIKELKEEGYQLKAIKILLQQEKQDKLHSDLSAAVEHIAKICTTPARACCGKAGTGKKAGGNSSRTAADDAADDAAGAHGAVSGTDDTNCPKCIKGQ